MRTTRQAAASRANGSKSRGPKTPEGKRRSSINALRHGLLSDIVVLDLECRDTFNLVLQQHYDKFAPSDDVEACAIEEMATTLWRLRRLWSIETNLIDNALNPRPGESEGSCLAAAFSKLASGPELHLLGRYEARMHRMYQRALNNFLVLQERSACENTHSDDNNDDGDDKNDNDNGGVSPLPDLPTGTESLDPQQPVASLAQKQELPNEPERVKSSSNLPLNRSRAATSWHEQTHRPFAICAASNRPNDRSPSESAPLRSYKDPYTSGIS